MNTRTNTFFARRLRSFSAIFALGVLLSGPALAEEQHWPEADWQTVEPSDGINGAALKEAVSTAVTDGGATHAVVVVENGRIIAEAYDEAYSANSTLFSYSMAKSFTGTLVGILARDGKLNVEAPAPVPLWQGDGDPRGEIKLAHLMNMNSGIATNEAIDQPGSDVSIMLFGIGRHDVAHYAANHPLKYKPGSYWIYSNSTSNVIAGIAGDTVGGGETGYRAFIEEELTGPLGMKSAVFGFDRSGTFIGSSMVWATARDYARFGLLYLRDGMWKDRRVLAKGWTDYVATPAPGSDGKYGGQFWIGPSTDDPAGVDWPEDAYCARGLAGQLVCISEAANLVVVVLGNTAKMPGVEKPTRDQQHAYRDRQIGRIFKAAK